MSVNLKCLRRHKHVSQTQLADRIGITSRYIRMLEKQECNGSIQLWLMIANALDTTVDELCKLTIEQEEKINRGQRRSDP